MVLPGDEEGAPDRTAWPKKNGGDDYEVTGWFTEFTVMARLVSAGRSLA